MQSFVGFVVLSSSLLFVNICLLLFVYIVCGGWLKVMEFVSTQSRIVAVVLQKQNGFRTMEWRGHIPQILLPYRISPDSTCPLEESFNKSSEEEWDDVGSLRTGLDWIFILRTLGLDK